MSYDGSSGESRGELILFADIFATEILLHDDFQPQQKNFKSPEALN